MNEEIEGFESDPVKAARNKKKHKKKDGEGLTFADNFS